MRDASLDEFLATDGTDEGPDGEAEGDGTEAKPGSEDAEPGAGPEPEPEGEPEPDAEPSVESGERTGGEDEPGAEAEGPPPVADVEPARSTFAWSADGAACAACGERVEERWDSETGLVCTECKQW